MCVAKAADCTDTWDSRESQGRSRAHRKWRIQYRNLGGGGEMNHTPGRYVVRAAGCTDTWDSRESQGVPVLTENRAQRAAA